MCSDAGISLQQRTCYETACARFETAARLSALNITAEQWRKIRALYRVIATNDRRRRGDNIYDVHHKTRRVPERIFPRRTPVRRKTRKIDFVRTAAPTKAKTIFACLREIKSTTFVSACDHVRTLHLYGEMRCEEAAKRNKQTRNGKMFAHAIVERKATVYL